MHLLGGWQSFYQILHYVPCQWGGGIPDVVVQQTSDPPSDLWSKSHLWNVNPLSLGLVVRLKKLTHQGLLLQMAGSSSGHGAGWPQM